MEDPLLLLLLLLSLLSDDSAGAAAPSSRATRAAGNQNASSSSTSRRERRATARPRHAHARPQGFSPPHEVQVSCWGAACAGEPKGKVFAAGAGGGARFPRTRRGGGRRRAGERHKGHSDAPSSHRPPQPQKTTFLPQPATRRRVAEVGSGGVIRGSGAAGAEAEGPYTLSRTYAASTTVSPSHTSSGGANTKWAPVGPGGTPEKTTEPMKTKRRRQLPHSTRMTRGARSPSAKKRVSSRRP
jgi:hypothetical protein